MTATLPLGAIRFSSVSKKFKKHTLTKKSYTTVKTTLLSRFLKRTATKENTLIALDTFSLDIKPGSSLGIIGRNGSGKSTLLKLIAGIYQPDTGSVEVNGKISALIELGAGFHPDFTGRENIYLGGVMYGLSKKEIEAKFDSIVSYAELQEFIDDPVRTYSSGMYMRLGFSLAVHTDPNILLIDEVLAVGDAGFIHKCKDTISDFKRRGKTLILVTHDLPSVERWCDEAIWFDKGEIKKWGKPQEVINAYLESVESQESKNLETENMRELEKSKELEESFAIAREMNKEMPLGEGQELPESFIAKRWGNKKVEINDVVMTGGKGEKKWLYHTGDEISVTFHYKVQRPIENLAVGLRIVRADGLCIHGTNTEVEKIVFPSDAIRVGAEGTCTYNIRSLSLLEGTYYLAVAAHSMEGLAYDYHHMMYKFNVRSTKQYHGILCPEHTWKFSHAGLKTVENQ